jgi:hypothetical protein
MPIESYPDQVEPADQDSIIWRFMNLHKFRDFMESGDLYFCRADRFPDESEGLPPEEYLPVLNLNPLALDDRQKLDHSIGCMAQFREAYYVSCWHLYREETIKMWREYGEDGVAVCSRYQLLKSALDGIGDRAYIGLVRYGSAHLTGWNTFRFITTKRMRHADEREVRAFLWIVDPYAGINRHFDDDNRAHRRPLTPPPDRVSHGERRVVDLRTIVNEIVVTPWASSSAFEEISRLVRNSYSISVRPSSLTRFRDLLPNLRSQDSSS